MEIEKFKSKLAKYGRACEERGKLKERGQPVGLGPGLVGMRAPLFNELCTIFAEAAPEDPEPAFSIEADRRATRGEMGLEPEPECPTCGRSHE